MPSARRHPAITRTRPIVTAVGSLVGTCLLLAGCGGGSAPKTATGPQTGSTPTGSGTSPATTTATTTTSAPPKPRLHGAALGATQPVHADGASLHVTVTGIIDPVPKPDAAPPPGDRAVAVELRIANEAGATYDSTASGDVSIVPSAGVAAPLFIKAGPCQTPLVDFESHLYPGDVRTGCVGFSLPRAARVLGVRFSPHAQARGAVTWR